jgi:starch phosphorylase
MVSEYTQRFYIPAAARWEYLTAEACSKAKALSKWKSDMKKAWSGFAIKDVQMQVNNGGEYEQVSPVRNSIKGTNAVEKREISPSGVPRTNGVSPNQSQLKVGSQLSISALVKLDSVSPDDVSVELYHGPIDSWGNIKDGWAVRMDYKEASERQGEHWFAGSISCKRTGQHGVTVRVLPKHPDLVNSYEPGLILWETIKS